MKSPLSPLRASSDSPRAASQLATFKALFWLAMALVPFKILLSGYSYGTGNQHEQLPMVLRALSPDYLRADWVVNSNQGFNHRWFYTQLMASAGRMLSVPGAFYGFYVGSMLLWATGAWALFHEIWAGVPLSKSGRFALGNGEDTDSALPTPLILGTGAILTLALFFFSKWGIISNDMMGQTLVPAALVWPLSLWFAVLLRRGQLKIAGVLLLVAGLLHAQIGPFTGFFILIAQFYALSNPKSLEASQQSAARRDLVRHWPFWLVGIALPLGLALISTAGKPLTPAQSHQVIELLVYVRHPWHYAPFTWTAPMWMEVAAWLGVVFLARAATAPSRFLDGLIGVVLMFCATGFLPFLIDRLFPLVKLQHFRMTVYLQIAGDFYVARMLAELLVSRGAKAFWRGAAAILVVSLLSATPEHDRAVLLVALPLSLAAFLFLAARETSKSTSRAGMWALLPLIFWLPLREIAHGAISGHLKLGILAAVFVLGAVWLGVLSAQSETASRPALERATGAVFALGMLLLVVAWHLLPGVSRLVKRIQPQMNYEGAMGDMAAWVGHHTPQNAVFITPPDDESFRTLAQRAIVADFKVFPWSDSGFLDWRTRINDLSGGAALSLGNNRHTQLTEAYASLTPAKVGAIARKYGASYFVAPASSSARFARWPRLYANSEWALYRVAR